MFCRTLDVIQNVRDLHLCSIQWNWMVTEVTHSFYHLCFCCFLDWKNMRVNKWYSQHSLKWKFTLGIITDIAIVPLSSAFPLFIILNEYTNCQIHYCGLQPNSLQYNFSYSNKDIVVFRELKFEKTMIVGWRTTWIETACQRNKFETGKACGYQVWDNGPKRAETHYWSLSNIGYLSFTRPGNLSAFIPRTVPLEVMNTLVLNLSIQFMLNICWIKFS